MRAPPSWPAVHNGPIPQGHLPFHEEDRVTTALVGRAQAAEPWLKGRYASPTPGPPSFHGKLSNSSSPEAYCPRGAVSFRLNEEVLEPSAVRA